MRIQHLTGAVVELHSSQVTAQAKAKSVLRLLTPKELQEALKISQDLTEAIEAVILDQAGVWSQKEIATFRARAALRAAQLQELAE